MAIGYLSSPELGRYQRLLHTLKDHLDTVEIDHRSSTNPCRTCHALVPKISTLIERRNHQQPPVPVDPFADYINETSLDAQFQSIVPSETQAAASILQHSNEILRTFGTIAYHRDRPNATNVYFPQGITNGLRDIGQYATKKSQLAADPANQIRWNRVALVCCDY